VNVVNTHEASTCVIRLRARQATAGSSRAARRAAARLALHAALAFGVGSAAAVGPTGSSFVPSGPITLTAGQVVTGLHVTNPNGPCITGVAVSNVRITNNRIGPCGPTATGVGIELYQSASVRVDHNAFDDVASALYALQATNDVVFQQNLVTRVRGPGPRGQMVQFDKVSGGGHKIMCNVSDQTSPGYLNGPEDHISIYQSSGTATSPIEVAANKLRGGGPSTSGGGIVAGDAGGQHVRARDNILVDPGQYGFAIAGGQNFNFLRNRVYAATAFAWSNIGAYVWAQDASACYGHEVRGNHVFYQNGLGSNPYWNAGNCGTVAGEPDNLWEWGTTTTLSPAIWNETLAECVEPTPPAAPTGLAASASAMAPANVALSWTDASNNEDNFVVERAAAGGSFAAIASLAAGTASYVDVGRPAGTWNYRVKAVNTGGDSGYSNTVSVSIASAPEQYTGTLLPVANGAYRNWAGSNVANVNESSCDGTASFANTTIQGSRVSYRVSLATVPVGATIRSITLAPCASRHQAGSGTATLQLFYRFGASDGPSTGNYALSGTIPVSLPATSYSGLALTRTSSSTLEIGAVYGAGTRGARLSRIAAVIGYTVP
jgi:hypothetical protein